MDTNESQDEYLKINGVRVKKDSLKRISKKNYQIKERNIRVIRPLVYCREEGPACFSAPKERARVKILL